MRSSFAPATCWSSGDGHDLAQLVRDCLWANRFLSWTQTTEFGPWTRASDSFLKAPDSPFPSWRGLYRRQPTVGWTLQWIGHAFLRSTYWLLPYRSRTRVGSFGLSWASSRGLASLSHGPRALARTLASRTQKITRTWPIKSHESSSTGLSLPLHLWGRFGAPGFPSAGFQSQHPSSERLPASTAVMTIFPLGCLSELGLAAPSPSQVLSARLAPSPHTSSWFPSECAHSAQVYPPSRIFGLPSLGAQLKALTIFVQIFVSAPRNPHCCPVSVV